MNTGKVLFSNNGSSRLYAVIDGASTSIRVEAGDGAKFPQPAGDGSNWFMVTIEDRRNNTIEICKCTGRSGDILNVVRAQEGTTGKTFEAGANVSNRLTVGTMETFFQFNGYSMAESDAKYVDVAGDTMTGALILHADPATDLQAATKKYVDDVSIDEAPADDRAYARMNVGWIPVGVGLPEAPTDGTFYGRQNAAWVASYTQVDLDNSFDQIGAQLGTLDARLAANEQTDVDQENQITNLETANITQDSNIAAIDAKNIEQDNRLLAIEGVNTTQDGLIAAATTKNTEQDGRLTAIEGVNTTQTTRLDGIDTLNNAQNVRLTNVETKNIQQDGRLDAVETKNTAQDSAIALRLTDAPSDGLVYGRKSGTWATVIGGATTDDAPPAGPLQDGQLWWKSSTGQLYIWYDDGNSQQWVHASASPQTVAPTTRNRGYIDPDFHLLNDTTDATNDIVFPGGVVASEVAPYPLLQHTQTIRQVDVVFDTNNSDRFGGRFSSAAVTDGTWHCFVISNGTVTRSGFSKNANPTADDQYPAGYTHYRRVASWLREAGIMIPLRQEGDYFWRLAGKSDYSSAAARAAALLTLSVPLGINVRPILATSVSVVAVSSNCTALMASGNAPTTPAMVIVGYAFTSSQANVASVCAGTIPPIFLTNLSAQLWFRADVNGTVNGNSLTNQGWVDKRGQA